MCRSFVVSFSKWICKKQRSVWWHLEDRHSFYHKGNGNYCAQYQLGLLHACIQTHMYTAWYQPLCERNPSHHNTDGPRASTQTALFNNLPDLQQLWFSLNKQGADGHLETQVSISWDGGNKRNWRVSGHLVENMHAHTCMHTVKQQTMFRQTYQVCIMVCSNWTGCERLVWQVYMQNRCKDVNRCGFEPVKVKKCSTWAWNSRDAVLQRPISIEM